MRRMRYRRRNQLAAMKTAISTGRTLVRPYPQKRTHCRIKTRSTRAGYYFLIAAIFVLLSACNNTGIRPGVDDQRHWQLSGKLGLRGPQLAESAYLNWRQCGEVYDIRLSGPLGQTVARIEGRGELLTVRLEGQEPVTTADPEQLLQQQLGWSVPVRALRYWVRAEAAPGATAQTSGAANQPESLQQFGWQVRYPTYHQNNGVALPAKLILNNGSLQATLLINEWLLSDAVEGCPR
jgi:outer membrane lipoprotein LolB